MATSNEVMNQLQAWGSEQTRKTYGRHGVIDPMYGVSFANIGTLKKKIKTDHALALDLWATGNHDARIFALMVADTAQADRDLLERWVDDINCYPLSDALVGYAGRTPLALAKPTGEAWIERDGLWVEHTGWGVLGRIAYDDATLPDLYFEAYIPRIERDIHTAKNRVRHMMNNLLIAIGSRNPSLTEQATAAAKRIGKVVVDHGDTGCKTPDAVSYIQKILDRKNKKK